MRPRIPSIAISLLLATLMPPAAGQVAPNHKVWLEQVEAANLALDNADPEALYTAITGVLEQAARFPDTDGRIPETSQLLERATDVLEAHSRLQLIELIHTNIENAEAEGSRLNRITLSGADILASLYSREGRLDEYMDTLAAISQRARDEIGEFHESTLWIRLQEASWAAQSGRKFRARLIVDEIRSLSEQAFGPRSAEHARILSDLAGIEPLLQEESDTGDVAVQRLTESIAIAEETDDLHWQVESRMQLGSRYVAEDDWPRALEVLTSAHELYGAVWNRVPRETWVQLYQLLQLSALQMGDGAESRRYMARAIEIAESVQDSQPNLLINLLLGQASTWGFAGLKDEAQRMVLKAERLILEVTTPQTRSRYLGNLCRALVDAGLPDRGLEYAHEFLQNARPGSAEYAVAARSVAYAGAFTNPPQPRLELAEGAFDAVIRLGRATSPWWYQDVIAVTHRALGEYDEALEVHEALFSMLGERSALDRVRIRYLHDYAETLRAVGRADDPIALAAEDRLGRLAAGLLVVPALDVSLLAGFPGLGFTVELDDRLWYRWERVRQNWSTAAFGALFDRNSAALTIHALFLPPNVNSETVLQILMNILPGEPPSLTPWSDGRDVGYEVSYELRGERDYSYQVRIVIRDEIAYMIHGNSYASDERAVEAVRAGIGQVRIHDSPQARSAWELPVEQRASQGEFLAWLGHWYRDTGELDRAIDAFESGYMLSRDEATLDSLVATQFRLERYTDIVEMLDDGIVHLDSGPGLIGARAMAKIMLEDTMGATEDLELAFEAGLRHDELAGTLVRLLLDQGRDEDAMAFIEDVDFDRTVMRPGLEAVAYAHMSNEELVTTALSEMEAVSFDSPDTSLIAASIYFELRGIEALADYVEKARAAEATSPLLFTILAATLLEAGQFDDALAAAEDGLVLAPFDETLLALRQSSQRFARSSTDELGL